eukprot:scaffold4795_cov191-Skeletonema_marinoi.AAC.1
MEPRFHHNSLWIYYIIGIPSPNGSCMNGAINPEEGCWKCAPADYLGVGWPSFGFGNPGAGRTDICTACPTGTSSEIVDGKSQCVCENGAIDPWPSSVSLVNVKRALQEKRMLDLVNADGTGECI